MKTFTWKLDRTASKGDKAEATSDADLFLGYLNGACRSAYKDGMSNTLMRRLFNISNAIEKSKNGKIEMEDAEFSLIEEAFERAKFDPSVNKMVIQIYDSIDKTKLDDSKKAEKKEK